MKYKVLLLTSGVGSRLGNFTNYTNKSLVRVGDKPTISHIIDYYHEDAEFVVTLGYFGEQVKEYLELTYPDRKIKFVWVDNYNGPGSSLVYSLLQTKDYIDCPFIFHTCDTIIRSESIQIPDKNWVGGYKGTDSTQYATLGTMGGFVKEIYPKGQLRFDALYIGLSGIYNYKEFFINAQEIYNNDPNNSQLSDIEVLPALIKMGLKFEYKDFPSWLDIGNTDKLKKAREYFDCVDVLDKDTESIYILDNKVIKFFYDKDIVSKRVKRAEVLEGLAPTITGYTDNFYMYDYVQGDLLSKVLNPQLMRLFLEWASDKLWLKAGSKDVSFYETCRKFYIDKTNKRLYTFFIENTVRDKEELINGDLVPKVFDMLNNIPEKLLCDAAPYNFHGDFISDNIIVSNNNFTLLDWRQDFGGELQRGDIYYDLAKFNHNLIFNHKIINDNNFSVIEKEDTITVDLLMSNNLYNCQKVLFNFLKEEGFSVSKVNIISSIIWLNMAPLHHHPLNIFLYYFGKVNLFRALKEGAII